MKSWWLRWNIIWLSIHFSILRTIKVLHEKTFLGDTKSTFIYSPQKGSLQQIKIWIPSKSIGLPKSFIGGIYRNMGKGLLTGAEMCQGELNHQSQPNHGWQRRKAGNLAHSVQPIGSSPGLRVSFPGGSVSLSLFQTVHLVSVSSRLVSAYSGQAGLSGSSFTSVFTVSLFLGREEPCELSQFQGFFWRYFELFAFCLKKLPCYISSPLRTSCVSTPCKYHVLISFPPIWNILISEETAILPRKAIK